MAYSKPTFGGAGAYASGVTDVSFAWPTHSTGDVGFLAVNTDTGDATLNPSGWTHVTGSPVSSGTCKLNLLWKRATSDSESAVVLSATDHCTGAIFTITGVSETGTPYANLSATQESSVTTISIPTVEPGKLGCLAVAVVSRTGADSFSKFSSWTLGSGSMTERIDSGTAVGRGGGLGVASAPMEIPTSFWGTVSTGSYTVSVATFCLTFVTPNDRATLIGVSTATSSGTSSCTVTYPSTVQAGDLAVLVCELSGGDANPSSSGYTLRNSGYDFNTTAGSKLAYLTKTLTGSEGGGNFTVTGGTDHIQAKVLVFRDAYYEADAIAGDTSAGSTLDCPTITVGDNAAILMAVSAPTDATGSWVNSFANTNLGDIVEVYDGGITTGNGGKLAIGLGYKDTAGSTGSSTANIASSYTGVGAHIGLRFWPNATRNIFWANNC